MLKHLLHILCLFFAGTAVAQHSTLRKVKVVPQLGDTLIHRSEWVDPGSLTVSGPQHFKWENGNLVWKGETPTDTVVIRYRVVDFQRVFKHKDVRLIQEEYQENPFAYKPGKTLVNNDFSRLTTRGNVSRGVGFGNAQDVVVNSNLNLRLRGVLANDVTITAAISDENNPIQPDGNTQQIQDFDQVYITLERGTGQLTVGDFLMQSDSSHFIRYYKKSRGLQFASSDSLGQWKVGYGGEVAISRGRFSRNEIQGIEGNAGPYRMQGTNGEQFIIVIAGTEKVYLDGKLLSRGEAHDYVINYNTGEISFTPQVLITRYSRIVVEFQYSDRNYARSVSRVGSQFTKNKTEVYWNYFSEQDLRSQPFQQELDGFDEIQNKSVLDLLEEAGDQTAIFNNVKEQEAYNPERIMYKKETVGGVEVYVQATDPEENATFYEVYFSNVGQGNGSYVQAQTGANGKVFEYLGEGSGNYEPIEVLIAPKRLRSFNIGLRRKHDNGLFGMEYVMSDQDKNTLSALDDGDNRGHGIHLYRTSQRTFRDSSDWKYTTNFDYEMVTDKYQYIERYRSVEFDRQWNKVLNNPGALAQLVPSVEQIGSASLRIQKKEDFYIQHDLSLFDRQNHYNGLNNKTAVGVRWKKTTLSGQLEALQSGLEEDPTVRLTNAFIRTRWNVEQALNRSVLGVNYTKEGSEFQKNDSLQDRSYSFDEWRAYWNSTKENKFTYGITAGQRVDDGAFNETYATKTKGQDAGIHLGYRSPKANRFNLRTTYRTLEVDTARFDLANQQEQTLQSRLELDLKLFKQFVRSRTFYQIGTGQEQRREFQYFQVQPGNGVYIWNDYDSNGIKTLNEFEIASSLDRQRADHIKIFTPVDGFFTTQQSKLSQTLELRPAVFYRPGKDEKKKGKPLYTRFSSITSVIFDRKMLPQNWSTAVNPWSAEVADTGLINSAQKLRSTVFFNRGHARYAFDYSYVSNASKLLLTNGFDEKQNTDHIFNGRWNIGRSITVSSRGVVGERSYTSEFFSQRNFLYHYAEVEPKIQWVRNNRYRISLSSKYYTAQNQESLGGEETQNLEWATEFKYTQPKKGSFQLRAAYVKVDFTGDPSSTLGYELLRGLQNGNNATWNINYQHRLGEHLQINFTYDGRRSQDVPVLHIGRAVARYLF